MKTRLPIINTLLLVAIFCYLLVNSVGTLGSDKQVYVVTGELFSEFEYQQELDAEYIALKEDKLKGLEQMKQDVLFLERQASQPNATEEDIAYYRQSYGKYLEMEAALNNELAEINGQYTSQIWDKLNAFVTAYGEENNYEVIFGAGGNGNIMYATDKKNITKDLIAYCNAKYNGK